MFNYDVIVVGAGHAGCEAAVSAARLGQKVLLTTLNIENIALMPCNPAIGGPAKSCLVREIDALGGVMGVVTDATYIQMKMLNRSKGPAVRALRAQSDKKEYTQYMRNIIESTPNIWLKQCCITELKTENGRITGAIDELFDYKYGELLYRCLNFVYEILDEDSFQEVAVVNYPNDPYFTRITEFKKLTWQDVEGKTAIMREYPGFNGEKCYPYPTQEYLDKFKLYEAEMEKEENVIFAGRLAKYKYYNMDLVVREALDIFENQIK